MKLEDEIKQTKPFKNELEKLMVNIFVTSSWLNSLSAERLKPFGISPPQYNVLRILKGKHPEGYCNHEITSRMIDKSSNVTRIVDKLLEKKLLDRKENKADRRLVDIKITPSGLKLLEEIEKNPLHDGDKMQGISEEQARVMDELLDHLRE